MTPSGLGDPEQDLGAITRQRPLADAGVIRSDTITRSCGAGEPRRDYRPAVERPLSAPLGGRV